MGSIGQGAIAVLAVRNGIADLDGLDALVERARGTFDSPGLLLLNAGIARSPESGDTTANVDDDVSRSPCG
ncbi:hypothetical protein [Amycolatopsis jiangsuensis]|uniref:NAD(P)-dependent dehydrogenase (Short-subunit alcohol dehydrogenase family) n=1 Tax=Amycolatopsis jiangsuensis TaxID=1181879 RepID=A0A840IV32_9PSEU|nr:hypothetical protein [Amycolatopsis jiangsuensis]MBB4686376.1 NAD(P)-dependent dehydrogenase (short-subunit alcohol dehydrogenase family) [Amycolatopsis jiangsuensis]